MGASKPILPRMAGHYLWASILATSFALAWAQFWLAVTVGNLGVTLGVLLVIGMLKKEFAWSFMRILCVPAALLLGMSHCSVGVFEQMKHGEQESLAEERRQAEEVERQRVARLRAESPQAYLSELRAAPGKAALWFEELRVLDPAAWEAENARRAAEIARREAELARQRAEQDAVRARADAEAEAWRRREAEQREAREQVELAALRQRIRTFRADDIDANLDVWRRIAQLAPGDVEAARQRDHYQQRLAERIRQTNQTARRETEEQIRRHQLLAAARRVPHSMIAVTEGDQRLSWANGGLVVSGVVIHNTNAFAVLDTVLECGVYVGMNNTDRRRFMVRAVIQPGSMFRMAPLVFPSAHPSADGIDCKAVEAQVLE